MRAGRFCWLHGSGYRCLSVLLPCPLRTDRIRLPTSSSPLNMPLQHQPLRVLLLHLLLLIPLLAFALGVLLHRLLVLYLTCSVQPIHRSAPPRCSIPSVLLPFRFLHRALQWSGMWLGMWLGCGWGCGWGCGCPLTDIFRINIASSSLAEKPLL